jgi:hypothetical protein
VQALVGRVVADRRGRRRLEQRARQRRRAGQPAPALLRGGLEEQRLEELAHESEREPGLEL